LYTVIVCGGFRGARVARVAMASGPALDNLEGALASEKKLKRNHRKIC